MHQSIQSEILAAVLKGEYSDKDVLRYVDPGFFTVDSHQWLVKKLKDRNWDPIAWDYVDPLLQDAFKNDEDKKEVYRNQIWTLYTRDLTFKDDAVRDFVQFVAVSKAKAAIKDSFDSFEKSNRADFFFDTIKRDLVSAERVLHGESYEISDYAARFKERMKERVVNRDNPEDNPVIKLGFRGLDDNYEVKGAQIVNFLAPFKSYKSILLNGVSAVGLMQSFNVAQVIFENTVKLTEDRHDAFFNRMNYNRLKAAALTPSEFAEIEERMSWIDSWMNRLKIIKLVSKKHSMHDVEARLKYLEETSGFVPDMLVVDYANIAASSDKSIREERLQQAQVMWDMKNLVDFRGIPLITATQTNQEGNKAIRGKKESKDPTAPKNSVDSTHQGKAIDISQAVDLSISINQTPEEKEERIIRLNPFLVRDGDIPGGDIVLNCDIKKMQVSCDVDYLWEIAKRSHDLRGDE